MLRIGPRSNLQPDNDGQGHHHIKKFLNNYLQQNLKSTYQLYLYQSSEKMYVTERNFFWT
jgi:hypothetical protein